jgi:hypothetical protein
MSNLEQQRGGGSITLQAALQDSPLQSGVLWGRHGLVFG